MNIPDNIKFCLAFTCSHVAAKEAPCLLVTHHKEDGTWEFMCGAEGHTASDAVVSTVGELLLADPTLSDALCIQPDYYAMRPHVGDKWVSAPLEDDSQ